MHVYCCYLVALISLIGLSTSESQIGTTKLITTLSKLNEAPSTKDPTVQTTSKTSSGTTHENSDPVFIEYVNQRNEEHYCHCRVADGVIIQMSITYHWCDSNDMLPEIPVVGQNVNKQEIAIHTPGQGTHSTICSKVDVAKNPEITRNDEIVLGCLWQSQLDLQHKIGCYCVTFPYGNYGKSTIDCSYMHNIDSKISSVTPTLEIDIDQTKTTSSEKQASSTKNLGNNMITPTLDSKVTEGTDKTTQITFETTPIVRGIETQVQDNGEKVSVTKNKLSTKSPVEISSAISLSTERRTETEIPKTVSKGTMLTANLEDIFTKPPVKQTVMKAEPTEALKVANKPKPVIPIIIGLLYNSIKQAAKATTSATITTTSLPETVTTKMMHIKPCTVGCESVTVHNSVENQEGAESDVNVLSQNVNVQNQTPVNVSLTNNFTANVTIIVQILQNLKTEYDNLMAWLQGGMLPVFILIFVLLGISLLCGSVFAASMSCHVRQVNIKLARIVPEQRRKWDFEEVQSCESTAENCSSDSESEV